MGRSSTIHPIRQTCSIATAARSSAMLALLGALSACGGNAELPQASASMRGDSIAPTAELPATAPQESASAATAPPPIGPPAGAVPEALAKPRGLLLAGVPGTNAWAALSSPFEEDTPSSAGAPPRPRLTAVIDRAATVGQVNAALISAGARIVSMQPGNSTVTLELVGSVGTTFVRESATRLFASRAFQSIRGPGVPPTLLAMAPSQASPPLETVPSEAVDDHAPPP